MAPAALLPNWLRSARAREGFAPNETVSWDGRKGEAPPSMGEPSYTCRGIGKLRCNVTEWDKGLLDVQVWV